MARIKTVKNRTTLKYEMQKEFDRFNRQMERTENSTLKKKYDSAGWGNEALKDEIRKFKEDNKNLTRKELNSGIVNIKNKFTTERDKIKKEFDKTYKKKLDSLRDMVKTTAINYKVVNDELDPGVTLLGNKRTPKTISSPDDTELRGFHKELETGFFEEITNAFDVTSDKKQSTETFLKKSLENEVINYTNIKAKNVNQSPSSMMEAYKNIEATGKVVGYDLETIGAVDAHGIWKPRAITEFSFQTYDKNSNAVINNATAVMGMSKADAKELYNEIVQALDNGTLKDNNDLWVTANRMMKYGHENTRFETGANGLQQAVSFVDEDAVSNVFDKNQIWKGFQKHIDVHDNAKIVNGMKDYEYYFLETIANIKKQDLTLLGFNDAFFDSPIIDSQMNLLVDKYRDNPQALKAIENLFGGLDNVKFNPNKNRRIDFRAAINMAVDKKGYGAVFGEDYNSFLNEKALKSSMVLRQEYLVERHFPEAFNSGTAHLAVEDVRNLLRLGFEESDVLPKGKTLLGELMGIMNNEYGSSNTVKLSTPEEGIKKVLFANRKSQAVNYTGRGVLGFTVDNTNGSYKTGAGYMVGNASEAMGDISKQNIRIGGHIDQNQFYSFGGIKKMTMTDDFIKKANMHMPEYARREMYVVKLDKMLSPKHKEHEMASSTYLFFNELAEAEGQISSMFTYLGDYNPTKKQQKTITKTKHQVYGLDSKKIISFYPDHPYIYLDDLTMERANELGKLPKKLKKGQGYEPTWTHKYFMKDIKDYDSPKGYTFSPERFGGSESRVGNLYRSQSNKDLKYVLDPETGYYHNAEVVKTKGPKGKYTYNLNVNPTPANNLPNDLEAVYHRKRVLHVEAKKYETGSGKMKPLFTKKNGEGYYAIAAAKAEDDVSNLYYDYFINEKDKTLITKNATSYHTAEELGGLKPATKLFNPDDKRFELREIESEIIREISTNGTFKINDKLSAEEINDIISTVRVDSNGALKTEKIGNSIEELTEAFEEALEIRSERSVVDRARRHATDKIYKNSKRYAKLIEEMNKHEELKGLTSNADDVKNYLLGVAKRLSDKTSRNQILNGDDRDSLVVAALGYVPKGSGNNNKYIYGSTLYNFIESNDVFHSRHQGMSNLFDFIADKNGIDKSFTQAFDNFDSPESSKYLAVTHKLEAMYEYILNKAANEKYKTPEDLKKAINMAGDKSGVSKYELKGYFEFNVAGVGTQDKYFQSTINTLDNSDILRVNLKSGDEYDLINKVFKLYKGESNEMIDGEIKKASAMRSFVLDMEKRNKDIFRNNTLKELVEDVTKGANGGTISPQVIANRLIRGLNEVKEKDFTAGILKTDFNIANLAMKDNDVMKLVNIYMNNGDILKEAYENTSTFKNIYSNNKEAITEVVDKYFMPTFNGKTGKDALNEILSQDIYTKKQAHVVKLNWDKAREAHQENIGKLFELVSQGGGNIHFNSSGISIEMNGKITNFEGLAKTRYDHGTLYHQVGNSKVTAQLDLGWNKKTTDFTIQSNLREVFAKSYAEYNMKKINREIDAGEFSLDTLSLFVGKVQGSALREAIISDFNLHERNSQFRFGLGDAIGKHLEELIGTDEAIGRWGNLETIDKNVIGKIRKIVTSDNWKNGDKTITPELKELLIKNMIPMLQQTTKNEELQEILEMATFSNKDTQVAKASTDIHLGERYSQRWGDRFDNAQRPVTAAQKKIFKRGQLEEGIRKYIQITNNNKDIHVGNIIDEASTNAMKTLGGVVIDGVEQAITFGKANIGQVGLMAIVDNNFDKVIAENNTVSDLSEQARKAQFHRMKRKMNVYEQEKVMDARLMDAIFEMGANKQFISGTKDYMEWLQGATIEEGSENMKIASRLANVKSKISYKNGKLNYTSSEGELVDRGEAVLKYLGFGDKETSVHSKQFMGRLQYGVFEEKGGLKLSDAEVTEFLHSKISEIEKIANSIVSDGLTKEQAMAKASDEVLSRYFKTGFYVEDIRQKTYMKVMNEGVEKDMTNGLYVGLGQLDSRIANYMKENEYQGRKLSDFADQVLTLTEIDKIFVRNFKANNDFKTAEDLLKAIKAERYYDSVSMFDIIDDFKKSSMITSHAVAKHSNSGMIFENTIGSIFSIYKKEAGGDHNKALERLRDNLANNDVIDMFDDAGRRKSVNDVLEITNDGRLLHHSFKSNQANMSNDMFNTIESLNIDNLVNMIKGDASLKGLIHEGVKIFDPNSDSKYRIGDVYGDVIKTNLKHKDGTTLNDIVIGTRAQSAAEIAIDAEYMTIYDHSTVKSLEQKANIDKQIIDNRLKINNLQTQKKNAIANGKSTSSIDNQIKEIEAENINLRLQKSEVADALGDMTNISKGKKIGSQEFFIYNMQVMNKETASSVSDFLSNKKGIDDDVLESLRASFSGVLIESKDGSYELSKEYEGYKVLDSYMKNIKSRNMFKSTGEDTGLELELRKDMLELDEYKHLKDTYSKIRAVADEHIGPDAKISVRYAEQAHQIDSAHVAYKFNKGGGLIKESTLENYGFNRININDLVVSGADAEKLGLDSMFNTNYLIDLDEFGTLALPKAGKITGDNAIKETFQGSIMGIQQSIKEYRDLYTAEGSELALEARARIERKIEAFKENLRETIYDKHGMLYNAGKTEVEESFRVKSSTVSVMDSDVVGQGAEKVQQSLDIISSSNEADRVLLDKARINGKSIYELEKNGIYHDYIFVSSDVFENLGYFDEERMAKYFNKDISEIKGDLAGYKAKMKDALETHGDIFMGERYPAIWIGSDKPMRVFLDDNMTDVNRARLSMATMLSMNGDNDGDSISASLLRSEKGLNFLQYQLARETYIDENNLRGVMRTDNAIASIDAAMSERFGSQNVKFFKGLEAHMATESITTNVNFANKGKSDMIEELQTAVANGDINSVKAVKFNSLYGGKLYANYGGTSSMDALTKNEEAVNNMIDLANKVNIKAGNIFENINNTKINDAGDYVEHLNETFKIFDAMQNATPYNLTSMQVNKLKSIKEEMGITDSFINTMREDAVMRARWMDYQSETMAKSRKGSIGPINVALQQHRQAVDNLFDSSDSAQYAQKLAVQTISKEVEQEVISSKKGNVIFNITKTTDLKDTYQEIWSRGIDSQMKITDIHGNSSYMTARESLTSWMNSNLDDKKIKSIITEIEGKTSKNFVKEAYGAASSEIDSSNIDIVRSNLTNSYVSTLDALHKSDYAKATRKITRQGGNMVDESSVVALDRNVNTTDMITNILTYGEDRLSHSTSTSSGYRALDVSLSGSEKIAGAVVNTLDNISNVKVKGINGLAVGALGFAAGVLASGFAGGPIDQTSASDYAQDNNSKPQAVSVPTMMDQGGFATTSGGSGYIINVRANTNKSVTQTKKVLKEAASASVGGGVSVNMNIKERSERLTERDIESMIAGIF